MLLLGLRLLRVYPCTHVHFLLAQHGECGDGPVGPRIEHPAAEGRCIRLQPTHAVELKDVTHHFECLIDVDGGPVKYLVVERATEAPEWRCLVGLPLQCAAVWFSACSVFGAAVPVGPPNDRTEKTTLWPSYELCHPKQPISSSTSGRPWL